MSTQTHGGKGSSPRPIQKRKKFEENYDKIFPKKQKENKNDL